MQVAERDRSPEAGRNGYFPEDTLHQDVQFARDLSSVTRHVSSNVCVPNLSPPWAIDACRSRDHLEAASLLCTDSVNHSIGAQQHKSWRSRGRESLLLPESSDPSCQHLDRAPCSFVRRCKQWSCVEAPSACGLPHVGVASVCEMNTPRRSQASLHAVQESG